MTHDFDNEAAGTTLSKTAAIREARSAVGAPIGAATSWAVYGPYRYEDPRGPYTSHNYTGYQQALTGRARWAALVALALMGRLTDHAMWAVEEAEPSSVQKLVEIGLKADR